MKIKETMLTELGKGTQKNSKIFYSYDEDALIDSTTTLLLSIRTEGKTFVVVRFGYQETIFSPNENRDVSDIGLYIMSEKDEGENHHYLNIPWEIHIYKEGKSSSSSSSSYSSSSSFSGGN